jgi:hypothetical protein
MPNKVPGKLGEQHPAYLPTHATDAHQHAQTALRLSHAALGAAHLDMAQVRMVRGVRGVWPPHAYTQPPRDGNETRSSLLHGARPA